MVRAGGWRVVVEWKGCKGKGLYRAAVCKLVQELEVGLASGAAAGMKWPPEWVRGDGSIDRLHSCILP